MVKLGENQVSEWLDVLKIKGFVLGELGEKRPQTKEKRPRGRFCALVSVG